MTPEPIRSFPSPQLPDGLTMVALGPERKAEFIEVDEWASGTIAVDCTWKDDLEAAADWGRMVGVETKEGRLVAISGSWPFDIPVPGGRVDSAGLSFVSVHPLFRRRGLLRAMMAHHFIACERNSEPISLLTASEPVIYPRFGYAMANWVAGLTLEKGVGLREVPGCEDVTIEFETADVEKHTALASTLHHRAGIGREARPGWTPDSTLGRARWRFSALDVDSRAEIPRIAIARRGGEPTGFALFRRRRDWTASYSERHCVVAELVALDPQTRRALWSTLTNLDLVESTSTPPLPLDDPLFALLVNPVASKPRLVDDLWIRIVDVAKAFSARRYAAPLDIVIDVDDPLIARNSGRWRITGSPFSSTVLPVGSEEADLAIGIADLAGLYLGGRSLMSLLDAGLVEERTQGAAERLASALTWPRGPGQSRDF